MVIARLILFLKKRENRQGRNLENLFPSTSFICCVSHSKGKQTTLLRDLTKHCGLRTQFHSSPNWSRFRFLFSLETARLYKHGPYVNTYCPSHLLNGLRPDGCTRNDLYTNPWFRAEEIFNMIVVCLSSEEGCI